MLLVPRFLRYIASPTRHLMPVFGSKNSLNVASTPISVAGTESSLIPLSFCADGSLNWDILVAERMRLESDFVRESVRKNVSYTADAEGNVRLRKDGSKFDDFGISLVRKLRAYNDEPTYSSSGGYRQMRHTGLPNAAKLEVQGEGRLLLGRQGFQCENDLNYRFHLCRLTFEIRNIKRLAQNTIQGFIPKWKILPPQEFRLYLSYVWHQAVLSSFFFRRPYA